MKLFTQLKSFFKDEYRSENFDHAHFDETFETPQFQQQKTSRGHVNNSLPLNEAIARAKAFVEKLPDNNQKSKA